MIFDLCVCPRCAAADCKLKVWSLSEGKVNQLLVITDLQEPWRRYSVDITSTVEYQVPSPCIIYTTAASTDPD